MFDDASGAKITLFNFKSESGTRNFRQVRRIDTKMVSGFICLFVFLCIYNIYFAKTKQKKKFLDVVFIVPTHFCMGCVSVRACARVCA